MYLCLDNCVGSKNRFLRDFDPASLEILGPALEFLANIRLHACMQNKSKNSVVSSSDIDRDAIELLAKITKSWDITYGGEKPKLTVSKAKEVYSEVFWLRNQVEGALLDSVDFTKA